MMTKVSALEKVGESRLSKVELKAKAKAEAEQMVEDGNVDLKKVVVAEKRILEYLNESLKTIQPYVTEEVAGLGFRETVGVDGAKIEFAKGYDRLDYEKDPEYFRLSKALKERADNLKMAFKAKEELVLDGEVIPKVPVKFGIKDNIKVTF